MREIIRQHIKVAYLSADKERIENTIYKGCRIVVVPMIGQEWELFYAANKRIGSKLYLKKKDNYCPYTIDKKGGA